MLGLGARARLGLELGLGLGLEPEAQFLVAGASGLVSVVVCHKFESRCLSFSSFCQDWCSTPVAGTVDTA